MDTISSITSSRGTILFISIILVVIVFIHLAFLSPKGEEEYPVSEALDEQQPVIKFVENWRFLIIVTVLLILIAYTVLSDRCSESAPGAKGLGEGKLW